jgi:NAD(P)-dependent dehydrogenase (short-subunit alcohol dehydrogenase family)
MSGADFHRVTDVNIAGTWHAVSSDAGTRGASGFAANVGSKHAVNGLIKCMALDYGPKGLRSDVVSSGFVETPMTDKVFDGMSEAEIDYDCRSVPLGRFPTPEDVANAIGVLSSPQGAYARHDLRAGWRRHLRILLDPASLTRPRRRKPTWTTVSRGPRVGARFFNH